MCYHKEYREGRGGARSRREEHFALFNWQQCLLHRGTTRAYLYRLQAMFRSGLGASRNYTIFILPQHLCFLKISRIFQFQLLNIKSRQNVEIRQYSFKE